MKPRAAALALVLLAAFGCTAGGAWLLDRLFPPAVQRLAQVSAVVVDRDGTPLRAFTNADGLYRLATAPADVGAFHDD